ncbi:MAG: Virulence factor mviM, partial [uncultured Nocardioides sp.]
AGRSRRRDRRGCGGPRRARPLLLRHRGDRLCRPPRRRAGRVAVRDLAAGPGGRPCGRRACGGGRVGSRARHGVPGRPWGRRDGDRPVARHGGRGPSALPG